MRPLALIAAVLLAGCFTDVEIGDPEVQAACLYGAPVLFAGTSSGVATASVDLDDLDLDVPDGKSVSFASASMTAQAGVPNLAFADHVKLSVVGNADTVDIADHDVSFTGDTLQVVGDPSVDISTYVRGGGAEISVAIDGDVPNQRWAASVDMCFDVY